MGGRGHYSDGISIEQDARLAIGAGKIPNLKPETIQGYGTNIVTTQASPQLLEPTLTTVYPSDLGESVVISSSEAGDTGKVLVEGLDANFRSQIGVATLNGTAYVPVTSLQGEAQSWSRVNHANMVDIACAGTVSISGSSGLLSYILPVDQRAQVARYSIGINQLGQVPNIVGAILKDGGSTPKATVLTFFRVNGGPFYRSFGFSASSGVPAGIKAEVPIGLKGLVDIEYRAWATAAGVDVFARSSLILEELNV